MYTGSIDSFTYIAQNLTLHKRGQDWMGIEDFYPTSKPSHLCWLTIQKNNSGKASCHDSTRKFSEKLKYKKGAKSSINKVRVLKQIFQN